MLSKRTVCKRHSECRFSTTDRQELLLVDDGCFLGNPANTRSYPLSCNTLHASKYDLWHYNMSFGHGDYTGGYRELRKHLDAWSVFAPLDVVLRNMEYIYEVWELGVNEPAGEFQFDNGTSVNLHLLYEERAKIDRE